MLAIPVPWRKATTVQEASCFPIVFGFGDTGEDGEVVGSVRSRVDGIYPYLPLVAVSDSVVGGEARAVGKVGEEAGSVSTSQWEDRERNQASPVCVLLMGLKLLPPIGNLGGAGTGMRRVFDQELEAEVDGQDPH